jgi:hypothetical protein
VFAAHTHTPTERHTERRYMRISVFVSITTRQ